MSGGGGGGGGGEGGTLYGCFQAFYRLLIPLLFLDTSEFKGNLKRGNMVDDRANE